MARQIARKITAANVMKGAVYKDAKGNDVSWKQIVAGDKDTPGKSLDLFVVLGEATGVEKDKSAYGEFERFTGTFEATRLSDGEVFMSSKVIFPPPTSDLVSMQFHGARILRDDKGDPILDDKGKPQIDEKAKVRFAFIVTADPNSRALPDGTTEYKYMFGCKPVDGIGDAAPVDPFADMRGAIAAALPAPPTQAAVTDQSNSGDGKPPATGAGKSGKG